MDRKAPSRFSKKTMKMRHNIRVTPWMNLTTFVEWKMLKHNKSMTFLNLTRAKQKRSWGCLAQDKWSQKKADRTEWLIRVKRSASRKVRKVTRNLSKLRGS